ncbi:hypothetical protein OF83DRAFT_1085045 [Amylostereum chailletii]|nr:hypothetical protein OF83DRAFT_1085045 [Amylostereum chailletii]
MAHRPSTADSSRPMTSTGSGFPPQDIYFDRDAQYTAYPQDYALEEEHEDESEDEGFSFNPGPSNIKEHVLVFSTPNVLTAVYSSMREELECTWRMDGKGQEDMNGAVLKSERSSSPLLYFQLLTPPMSIKPACLRTRLMDESPPSEGREARIVAVLSGDALEKD